MGDKEFGGVLSDIANKSVIDVAHKTADGKIGVPQLDNIRDTMW